MTRRALLALLLGASPALAHEAPSGWSYDLDCCSSTDCAEVVDEAIEEVPGGYRVTLQPGQHPMVKGMPVTAFVAHGDYRVRKSGDWHKHACVSPAGHVFCIYLPPGGV